MTMLAVADGTVIADGQRWIRCTQNSTLGCNWLVVEEEQEAHQRGRCLADSLIRREPDASDTIAREKLVPTAAALCSCFAWLSASHISHFHCSKCVSP